MDLLDLFDKDDDGYGGNFEILDNNYWAVVGEKFTSNDRMF
ncbi:hypothetical protein [Paenibacillus ferrarius]|nr:hypothetical protein [Paenibacillus ferrarius]